MTTAKTHGMLFAADLPLLVVRGEKTTTLRPIIPQNSTVCRNGVRKFPDGIEWGSAVAPGDPKLHGGIVVQYDGGANFTYIVPRIQPGHLLCCREAWRIPAAVVDRGVLLSVSVEYRADGGRGVWRVVSNAAWKKAVPKAISQAIARGCGASNSWSPSLVMPAELSRAWMPVAQVEAVRVGDLDEAAAQADGFASLALLLANLDATYGRWPSFPWLWRYSWVAAEVRACKEAA